MATSLRTLMVAFSNALAVIPGLRTADHVPGQINPPQAVIMVPPVNYDVGFGRRKTDVVVTVTVLTSATIDQAGQHQLADYAEAEGDQSVKAAIEARDDDGLRSLGGVVEDVRVESFNPIGLTSVGSIGYYGGEFRCPVMLRP